MALFKNECKIVNSKEIIKTRFKVAKMEYGNPDNLCPLTGTCIYSIVHT